MEYFMEFHWWYLLVLAYVLFVLPIPGGKGGFVVSGFTAQLEPLDQRFKDCQPEASYSIFKEGQPDKIDIEVDHLHNIDTGEKLELQLNGVTFAEMVVKFSSEAEFEHWSDEGIEFPRVKQGDVLVIKYQGMDVLKGTFESDS